jgi:hypothetical protein
MDLPNPIAHHSYLLYRRRYVGKNLNVRASVIHSITLLVPEVTSHRLTEESRGRNLPRNKLSASCLSLSWNEFFEAMRVTYFLNYLSVTW